MTTDTLPELTRLIHLTAEVKTEQGPGDAHYEQVVALLNAASEDFVNQYAAQVNGVHFPASAVADIPHRALSDSDRTKLIAAVVHNRGMSQGSKAYQRAVEGYGRMSDDRLRQVASKFESINVAPPPPESDIDGPKPPGNHAPPKPALRIIRAARAAAVVKQQEQQLIAQAQPGPQPRLSEVERREMRDIGTSGQRKNAGLEVCRRRRVQEVADGLVGPTNPIADLAAHAADARRARQRS